MLECCEVVMLGCWDHLEKFGGVLFVLVKFLLNPCLIGFEHTIVKSPGNSIISNCCTLKLASSDKVTALLLAEILYPQCISH